MVNGPAAGKTAAVSAAAVASRWPGAGTVACLVGLLAGLWGCSTANQPPPGQGGAREPAATTSPPPAPSPADPSGGEPAGDIAQRRIVRKRLPGHVRSIALEYEVLRIDEGDRPVAVDPATHTFSVGDSFLVKIRPEDDLYVYVFNEDAARNRACLLPARDEPPRLVKRGDEIVLPDDGGYFTFEPPAGEEKLVVVALPEPTDDLKLLAGAVFRSRDAADAAAAAEEQGRADAALGVLRDRSLQSRGPVGAFVERVGAEGSGRATHVEPPAAGAAASYGIAIAPADDAQPELVLDIALKSQAGR